jgi:hypothetical protein
VNERGEGVVQIEVRGGPEAIGMFQQADAVRDGVVDMAYTPGSASTRRLPEKDALVASNLTGHRGARERRHRPDQRDPSGKDGRLVPRLVRLERLLQPVDGQRAAVRRRRQPRRLGHPLRGNPVYNAFFTNYLGAAGDRPADHRRLLRARARHRRRHRLDPDRPDGPALERVRELPGRALLLLDRSRRDREPRALERPVATRRGRSCRRSPSSTSATAPKSSARRDEELAALEEAA